MSLSSCLSIAQQALSVSQSAITVVSNNIANVDTEGYSKLKTNLAEVSVGSSSTTLANSLSGVQIANVQRYSDFSLENYYWNENSTLSYYDTYTTYASNIEDLVNELNDGGLSDALDNFYSAADALGDSPSDPTARQNYVSAAESVCSVFNTYSSNLTSIQETLVGTTASLSPSELSDDVTNVNNLLDKLAEINEKIVQTGQNSTTLLDSRDSIVEELSNYIPITAKENENGTVNVTLNNIKLVSNSKVNGYLSAENNSDTDGNITTTVSVVDAKGATLFSNINDKIDSGSIGAILDLCGNGTSNLTINEVMSSLNLMANEFASVLNGIQLNSNSAGTPLCINSLTGELTGSTEPLLVSSVDGADISAANISVNSAIEDDPYLIAAARTDTSSTTYSATDTGNNSNMALVMDTRNGKYIDNMTFEDYLASTVSEVGTQVSDLKSNLDTQTTICSEIQSTLASETGVNLDEELVDLMKYQQAYQAAARIISTCNDLFDTIVNLGK